MAPANSNKDRRDNDGITLQKILSVVVTLLIGWIGTSLFNNTIELRETRGSLIALADRVNEFKLEFKEQIQKLASKEEVGPIRERLDTVETRVRAIEMTQGKK